MSNILEKSIKKDLIDNLSFNANNKTNGNSTEIDANLTQKFATNEIDLDENENHSQSFSQNFRSQFKRKNDSTIRKSSDSKRLKSNESENESEVLSNDETYVGLSFRDEKNQLVVNISWPIKNKITNLYNRFNMILYGKKVSNKTREDIIKSQTDLMHLLLNLPLNSEDFSIVTHESENAEDQNELILNMRWGIRDKIFTNLIKNHHAAILYADSTTKEDKFNLIRENNQLIQTLMNLPVKVCDIILVDNADTNSDAFRLNFIDESDQINDLREELNEKLDNFKVNLRKDVQDAIIKSTRIRSEYNFLIILPDAKKFVNLKNKKTTQLFYILEIPFYLVICSKSKSEEDQNNYLSIFLHRSKKQRNETPIKIIYKFTLINKNDKNESRTIIKEKVFENETTQKGYGLANFISETELLEKNFIKNDELTFEISVNGDHLVDT